MTYRRPVPFTEIIGKTIVSVDGVVGDDMIVFECSDGTEYGLEGEDDCCNNVQIEDICGDLKDLIGAPILIALECKNLIADADVVLVKPDWVQSSFTWSFYRFATRRAVVTIRFFGTSNGYYAEGACFFRFGTA